MPSARSQKYKEFPPMKEPDTVYLPSYCMRDDGTLTEQVTIVFEIGKHIFLDILANIMFTIKTIKVI